MTLRSLNRVLVFLLAFLSFSPFSYARGGDSFYLKALNFLKLMYVPEVGLLREYWGSKRCWLYNDNFLAYKVLSRYNDYTDIASGIKGIFEKYNLSLDGNGRLEVLFGIPIDSPPKAGEHLYLDYKDGYSIFIEKPSSALKDWEEYGDLLLYEVINRFNKGEPYDVLWNRAKSMFDGFGLKDKVMLGTSKYETYKLGLFLFTANLLDDNSLDNKRIIDILSRLQDEDGGFITHYDTNFTWLGFSNVETTCFVLLALERKVKE